MGEQGHAKTGGERSATPRLAQGWAGREAADRPLCSARSLCTGLQLFPTPLCLLLPAPCEVVKATRGSMQPTPPPTQVSPSPHRCCFAGRAARAGWPRHGHGLLSARKAVLFHAWKSEKVPGGMENGPACCRQKMQRLAPSERVFGPQLPGCVTPP